MGWLEGFWKKQLEVLWEFSCDGDLWRLIPTRDDFLVGEARDIEAKAASFFCLSRLSGEALWKGVTFDEPWWIGIEDVQGNTIYLHEFQTPDMPIHKKIIALDLRSHEVFWRNDDLTFVGATPERVYASLERYDDRIFVELDAGTGKTLRDVEPGEIHALRNALAENQYSYVQFPESTLDEETVPANVGLLLAGVSGKKYPRLSTEYLVLDKVTLIGIFENTSMTQMKMDLRQQIFVFNNSDRKQIYSDVLMQHAANIIPDTFFVIDDILYYIKEKRQLIAVQLSSDGSYGKN